jgi:hypothetical protein
MSTDQHPSMPPDALISAVVQFRGIPRGEILNGMSRSNPVVWARHEATHLLRSLTHMSYGAIGKFMAGRDPKTVINSLNQVAKRMSDDMGYRDEIEALVTSIPEAVASAKEKVVPLPARQSQVRDDDDIAAALLTVATILAAKSLGDAEARTTSLAVIREMGGFNVRF